MQIDNNIPEVPRRQIEHIAEVCQRIKPLVMINCITYNHEPFLRDALEGFVMQKTDFPFVAVVHDDASTDGTAAILREYAERYPDIILPIFEEENLYSKRDGSLRRIMANARAITDAKYIAPCEGDDYWIDPLKLQKQVDFLEADSECTMICSRARLYSEAKKKYVGEAFCRSTTGYLSPKDIIKKGGLYIVTCSVVYRRAIRDGGLPDYYRQCHIGDYPLQIMAAMKGKVYYINELLSVYRVENASSWCGQNGKIGIDKLIKNTKSEVVMLQGFCSDFPMYKKEFKSRIAFYINRALAMSESDVSRFLQSFKKEIHDYSLLWKLDLGICKLRMYLLKYASNNHKCVSFTIAWFLYILDLFKKRIDIQYSHSVTSISA